MTAVVHHSFLNTNWIKRGRHLSIRHSYSSNKYCAFVSSAKMWTAVFFKVDLLLACLVASSADWLEQPGTVRTCVHEDVEFRWNFNENTTLEVTQIFWMFLKTGDSLLGWYKNTDSTHVYPKYVNRVGLLLGTNAGIVLKNVSEIDTGKYNIEMSGPGIRDVADLQIYSHDDLKPTIQVDNDHVRSGARLDKSNSSTVTISMKTAGDLSADITITIGGRRTHCTNNTLCSTVIVFCERGGRCEDNITVSFRADYGICANQTGEIYISRSASSVLTDVPVETSASSKTILIITLIFAVILIIVVVLLVVMSKKIWKRRSPNMDDVENKGSSHSDTHYVPHSDTTEQLIIRDNYFGQCNEASSASHVAVQCQNQSMLKMFAAKVQGIHPSRPTAPSVSYTGEKTPERERLRSAESRTGDLELPGKPEAEPEYQANTQDACTILEHTDPIASETEGSIHDIGGNPMQVNIQNEPDEVVKATRKAQAKSLAKKKRGEKTTLKDKHSTAPDDQFESDQTPESVSNVTPTSRFLTSDITPAPGLLAETDDKVYLPSAGLGNQSNIAVVTPQTATVETAQSEKNSYKGAFSDEEERKKIEPFMHQHSAL